MSPNARLIKESFSLVEPVAGKAAAYFHGRLFAEHPNLRALFPATMGIHDDRVFEALAKIVRMLDDPAGLSAFLARLGRGHRRYGVVAEHYEAVGSALLATIRHFAADAWTSEVEAAWTEAYAMVADAMIDAARAEARTRPPWWLAEVAGHELRAPDIAVVTLRPAQRLDFTPGQHVTVQTPRWPRVWRPFSIANAPREDGTLCLHVRAVPGGWVSSALVRHTRVGDQVMLGPPSGTMAPADTDRDMLCVAGGTGLAPIKAVIEHVIGSGRRPRIHLLFGARHAGDLYDLPDLARMASDFPRLRVLPVVSDDPGFSGTRGRLPEIMERLESWPDHEAYVCGPAAMVHEAVRRLRKAGVPPSRIHCDGTPGDLGHPSGTPGAPAVSLTP
ncbi:globin domain-containing protein [Sphaerimonospora cavernae]|uniref:nitric oxide dioxygenase n=1 Tax=Sphaerimonospora cavernae TaxID=1740611 RepID=A0ABV6U7V3_9ACTN